MLNNFSLPIKQQIKYFESVCNYYPMIKNNINKSTIDIYGPFIIFYKIFIKLISIFVVSRILLFTGNQPIRIMSFIAKKIKI
jgi:hypothetical protein